MELVKLLPKFIGKNKHPKMLENMKKKSYTGGLALPDIEIYYRAL